MIEQINDKNRWLYNLVKTNPKKARKIAIQNLCKKGMYDKDGNLISR